MKNYYISLFLLIFSGSLFAQEATFDYHTELRDPIPLLGVVSLSNLPPDFDPEIRYLAPSPGGADYQTFLMQLWPVHLNTVQTDQGK